MLISSCAYYNEKTSLDPSTITSQTVSWQRVSREFFQTRCDICHGQGGANINTSDYQSVIQDISRVKSLVLTRKSMPPDSPLTDYEQTLISVWINSGAPYEASGGGP